MKKLLFFLFILTIFCFAKCEKDRADFNGLPPATQEGKNTLGFLLNGQPWAPNGFSGTANLSIDVDLGFNNGVFNITAYRIINNDVNTKQTIGFGVSDSLNSLNIPITLQLGHQSLYGLTYIERSGCTYDFFDASVIKSGQLTLTKLDRTNRIISGTFNATLSKNGCTTISITDGRFDMKY